MWSFIFAKVQLVTEGGLTPKGIWKKHSFWPYEKMCSYWKYEILKRFRYHCRDSLDAKALIDRQWKQRFRNNTNGYVVKNYRNVLNVKDLGSYLARYVRHPPIGESRILAFDGEEVTIKYEWDNKINESTIPIDRFIEAILYNIPPKGFKVVRQYGLYSNLYYRWARTRIIPNDFHVPAIDQFQHNPPKMEILCPKCGRVMEPFLIEYIHNGEWMTVFL